MRKSRELPISVYLSVLVQVWRPVPLRHYMTVLLIEIIPMTSRNLYNTVKIHSNILNQTL